MVRTIGYICTCVVKYMSLCICLSNYLFKIERGNLFIFLFNEVLNSCFNYLKCMNV